MACGSSSAPRVLDLGSRRTTGTTGVAGAEAVAAYDRLTPDQITALKQRRILWGHQSVGQNMVQGARALGFDFRSVRDAADYDQVRWGEAYVERNGDPQRKIASFLGLMDARHIGSRVEAASFKFCWVDFTDRTDVTGLLARYDRDVQALAQRFPSVRLLHVTPPLMTDDPSVNAVRWRYGRELVQHHRTGGLVFDLAEVISTRADGRVCTEDGTPRLCDEWASDEGHLNDAGQRRAAKAFVQAFWRLLS